MTRRSETSAGGVVYRRVGTRPVEVAVAEQRDRLTAASTVRLPKGRGEPGETLEQTALREVHEEMGLLARAVGHLGSVRYVYEEAAASVEKEVHYFLMKWEAGDARALDGEMERVYWCPLDEAERDLTFETERRAIGWARERLERVR